MDPVGPARGLSDPAEPKTGNLTGWFLTPASWQSPVTNCGGGGSSPSTRTRRSSVKTLFTLLCTIAQLGDESYLRREEAEHTLIHRSFSLIEWRVLRSIRSSSPEVEQRKHRVQKVWTRCLCASLLPPGCTVYPDMDYLPDEVLRLQFDDKLPIGRPWVRRMWDWEHQRNGSDSWGPYRYERSQTQVCCLRVLRETGDVDLVKTILSQAYIKESQVLHVSRASFFGLPLIRTQRPNQSPFFAPSLTLTRRVQ